MELDKILGSGELHRVLPEGDLNEHVIASGPITKQPMTQAFREVLRLLGTPKSYNSPYNLAVTGFAVQTQYFPNYPSFEKSFCAEGSYFNYDELHFATAEFGKRLVNKANSMTSIYKPSIQAYIKPIQKK